MQLQAVKALEVHCKLQNVYINDSIEPRNVEGAGLGIYSIGKLKPSEKLVQVPVKQIFTTEQIPTNFLAQSVRADIAVHAQLAAFFAFASGSDRKPYEQWMATWPGFHDFTDTMPVFWGYWAEYILVQLGKEPFTDQISVQPARRTSKRRRVSVEENGLEKSKSIEVTKLASSALCLSPALSGVFKLEKNSRSTGQLKQMSDKLISHVRAIDKALPRLNVVEDDEQLVKFLHAWCLVNTRCFYYIPTMTNPALKKQKRAKAPKDPNEAMALCPFMDLFNHRAPAPSADVFGTPAENVQLPCKVKCTPHGFQIVTDSVIAADTELLLSYGAHTNDTLWSEYGFLLSGDTNTSDFVRLDEIVLDNLKPAEREVLEEHGYLGEYLLNNDGSVCYRTELVAWLLVLGSRKWAKVVTEGLDPEEECTSPTGKTKYTYTLKLWLQKVVEAADGNKSSLADLDSGQSKRIFGTMDVVKKCFPETATRQSGLVERRRAMCASRWDQLRNMALQGLQSFSPA